MESLCPKTPVFPQNGIAFMNADIYFIFLSYGYNQKSERVKKTQFYDLSQNCKRFLKSSKRHLVSLEMILLCTLRGTHCI